MRSGKVKVYTYIDIFIHSFIYSVFQISADVDTELGIIITISIIQNESYNKTQ